MMKKLKMFLPALMVAFSLVASLTASIAWFTSTTMVEKNNLLDGGTKGAYFAYGDGKSAGTAYGIKHPVHLYNLAWLQYLGFINDGTIGAGENKITYFELADDLNMSGWVIPPIGTEKDPFFGIVNGKNHTISNLTVSNAFNDYKSQHPTAISGFDANNPAPHIVGLFGVVGSYNNINNTEYTSNIYGTSANAIYAFNINGATIKTGVSDSLMGVLAGYVNGPIENCGISNSSLSLSNATVYSPTGATWSNISDYSVIGYCTDAYKDKVNHSVTTMYQPTTPVSSDVIVQEDGENQGWGGSIPMSEIFDNLAKVKKSAVESGAPQYPTAKTVNYRYDGTIETETYDPSSYTSTTNMQGKENQSRFSNPDTDRDYNYFTYEQTDGGEVTASYSITNYNSSLFTCLTGKKTVYVTNELTTTKNYFKDTERFYITYSDAETTHYLSLNGTTISDVSTTGNTPPADATAWCFDTNNRLYTFDANNHTSSQSITYLRNYSNTLSTGSIDQASTWTSNNSRTYFLNNRYKIYFNGTNWVLNPYYVNISTTDGTIMTHTGTTLNTGGTDRNFLYDGTGYYVLSDSTKYYLRYSNRSVNLSTGTTNLFTSTSANEFGEASNTYLQYYNSRYYYIYYSSGWTRSRDYASRFNITLANDQNLSCPAASSAKKYTTEEITEDAPLELIPTFFPLKQGNEEYGQEQRYVFYYTNGNTRYYLCFDGTIYPTYVSSTTNEIPETATLMMVDNNGYIRPVDHPEYYLCLYYYYNAQPIFYTSTQNNIIRMTFNNNRVSAYYNRNYYLTFSNGWSMSTTTSTINRSTKTIDVSGGTGVPLSTNTGYVVSGGNYWVDQFGDIRFGQFAKTTYLPHSLDTIYTIQSPNPGNSNNSIEISTSDLYEDSNRKQVFEKSKKYMQDNLDKTSFISGLHFMSATINKNSTTIIPKAIVNGTTYSNFEVPNDCIDFNLKEKGYINFFAGSYFQNQTSGKNDSFFTLHEIQRGSNPSNSSNPTPITNISEIVRIYTNNKETDSYVYEYATNNGSGIYSVPFTFDNEGNKVILDEEAPDRTYHPYSRMESLYSGYDTVVFDSRWIGINTLKMENDDTTGFAYYFDISMNAGEYALGSVPGGVGAYLMYLDIGANAEKMKRSAIIDIIKISEEMQSYPTGVFIIRAAGTSSDKNSYCISIKNSYDGTLSLGDISEGKQAIARQTPENANITLSYASSDLTVTKDAQINNKYSVVSTATETLIERATYIEYHPSNNTTTMMVVTKTTINNDTENANTTAQGYILKNGVWEEKDDLVLYYDEMWGNGNQSGKKVTDLSTYFDSLYFDVARTQSYSSYSATTLSNGTIAIQLDTNLYGATPGNVVAITFTPTTNINGNTHVHGLTGYDISISYVDSNGNVVTINGESVVKVFNPQVTILDNNGDSATVTLTFTLNSTIITAVNQAITITITIPVNP